MKAKEFQSDVNLSNDINLWLSKNKSIKIIDIKYSICDTYSAALIIYEEEIRNGR